MRSLSLGLTVVTTLLGVADAILVTDASPCDIQCGNELEHTTKDDIVCNQADYGSSSAGGIFQRCTRCELQSNYTANGQSDLQWMLYNVRYAMSYCLFPEFGNEAHYNGPCITSTACGPLRRNLEYGNTSKSVGALDYCDGWSETQATKCSGCLLAEDSMHYMNNFLVMLNATCHQKPAAGDTLLVAGDPFSVIPMNVTTGTPKLEHPYIPDHSFPLGARVGIAAGGIAFILSVIGCCIIWNGKRRRRRFLRELEQRHQDMGWPHPKTRHGGSDMLETPASQKPLRGWDDTPVSAISEGVSENNNHGRYFSPYSSQYTSPVSAIDQPKMQNWPALSPQKLTQIQEQELEFMRAQDELKRQEEMRRQRHSQQQHQPPAFTQWPSPTQEKLMQMQRERQVTSPTGVDIGVALGGDEASLRSKPSNPEFTTIERSTPTQQQLSSNNPYGVLRPTFDASSPNKGKNRDEEAYEMHEVPTSGGAGGGHYTPYQMPAEPEAPVLHHPGYGRHPSLRRTGTGSSSRTGAWALTEEDAVRGHAV